MRIVVAMSGGVDSSVAAALLAEQGHEVIGLSMQLYDQSEGQTSFGSCCSLDDLHDARRVAAAHRHPALHRELRAAVRRAGRLELRQRVRRRPDAAALRALQQRPEVRDAARARRAASAPTRSRPATTRASSATRRPAAIVLKRGVDPAKDQSYFLFSLTQEQLARAVFPVGDRPKDAVREYARRRGLPVADKPDSQEICFVPDDDYAAFVDASARRTPRATARSSTSTGRVLGRHARHPPLHGRPAQGARAPSSPTARRCTCSRCGRPISRSSSARRRRSSGRR